MRLSINKHSISAIAIIVLLGVVSACAGEKATPEMQAAMMERGVNALYKGGNAADAEKEFRDVLKANPEHYGAHYQLAVALQREGKIEEARTLWNDVTKRADAINDTATARTARQNASALTAGSDGALMTSGLAKLKANDVAGAAADFKKVTEQNPTHYGAHYQLAAALDRMGKRAESKDLWVKVLGMAVSYNDSQTIATARQRLAQTP